LPRLVSLDDTDRPLEMVDLPMPKPRAGDVLIRVSVCGVCHTELDEIEGRTSPTIWPIVLGHQVVGVVEQLGRGVTRHKVGKRVGVGWIHTSTGALDENLSPEFRATGRDVNGGYAEYMTIGEDYAYSIPNALTEIEAAPLLCAGAVGYRALRLTNVTDGQPLGLTGFGGSAHLVLQIARHQYPGSPVYVFARDPSARALAIELGATWAGDTAARPPAPLRSIIDTTPAWRPMVEALANLQPGGRLVINAIRKEDADKAELFALSYHEHLWMEREIKTVANVTQHDIREFLPLAAEIPIRPTVETYALEDANRAIIDLKRGPVTGAKVLIVDGRNT
jgi:propanol-preferring alcohol dehydrogenase